MTPPPIRKAVFPAAGLGTRLLPLTKAIPKELLPLGPKPVIEYGAVEAVASGCTEIVIVLGPGKEAIRRYFDPDYLAAQLRGSAAADTLLEPLRLLLDRARFTYAWQDRPLGLGHAVLMARDIVGDEPFAVLLPDDLIVGGAPALRELVEVYEATGAPVVALEEVSEADVPRYGIAAAEPVRERVWKLTDMVEKPALDQAPSRLALIGRYLLPARLFPLLDAAKQGHGGEIQLTDALRTLAGGGDFYGVQYTGTRHDCGTRDAYLQTLRTVGG